MKKLLLIITFLFSASGIAQAAIIDGESDGVTKHNVIGFGKGDILVASANPTATTVSLTDNGTAVADDGFPSNNTDGLVNGFIHDFILTAVQDTFVALSLVSQIGAGAVNTVSPLIMEVWHIGGGPMGVDAEIATVDVSTGGQGQALVNLTAMQTYVIRMTNEGGTIGNAADYTLNVLTPVPVPAAVWLFGTALLGLFGYKRKAQAAVAA